MNDTQEIEVVETVLPTVETNQNAPDLIKLIEEINQLQVEIESNETLVKSHGKICLELAIKSGGILWDCREIVKHGEWEKWTETNITTMSHETVKRYIRLFERSAVTDLTECQSLQEAYIRCSILKIKIPKFDEDKTTKEEPKTVEPVEQSGNEEPEVITEIPFEKVKRLEQSLRKVFIENEGIGYYDEMIKLLVPLVTLYQQHQFKQQEPEVPNEVVNG